ncbi:hypothetical protein RA280_38320 [Cupriavidus sp. CV2]|uniref:hypothetical protein n=1 Tax=Cupriavidus ulmosensis TaxID=3065913 RepID=UPI00296B0C98|nr:hypothetical protein [Cupriavidus sp. CV2]MDW3687492.1 hypothetical protein [Cupriavidus sp. CV2]
MPASAMTTRSSPWQCRAAPLIAAACAALALCGCAPDSVRNFEAKGFNAYLDSVQRGCPNMMIGNNNISDWLRTDRGQNDSDYVYWLDQTSRLYYQRITPAQYRDSVIGALGRGKSDARAVDCIVRKLPAQRPISPAGDKRP